MYFLLFVSCFSENLQLTGSFKIRGAFNKVCLLKEKNSDVIKSGVVSASTGNHALACVSGNVEKKQKTFLPF